VSWVRYSIIIFLAKSDISNFVKNYLRQVAHNWKTGCWYHNSILAFLISLLTYDTSPRNFLVQDSSEEFFSLS